MLLSNNVSLAQEKPILYDFVEIPQALLENPATKFNAEMHIGVPFLSKLHFKVNTFGISTYDLFAANSESINLKLESVLSQINTNDYLTVNQQLEILSFGFKSRNNVYWSAGLYQEFDFVMYYPKSVIDLFWYGNSNSLNRAYQLSDVKVKADLLNVYHLGLSKKISSKLRAGIRGKLYMGMANLSSQRNKGYFITNESMISSSEYTHYNHSLVGLSGTLSTSGMSSFFDSSSSPNNIINDLMGKFLFSPNLGVGLDIGITYNISKSSYVTASILDVGFIKYSSDINNYNLNGSILLMVLLIHFQQQQI